MARYAWKAIFSLLILSAVPAAFAQQANTAAASDQFQQWLQNNGYAQNQPAAAPAGQQTAAVSQQPVPAANDAASTQPVTQANTQAADNTPETPVEPPGQMSYEASRQAMLDSLPPGTKPPSADSRDAFRMLLQQNMPLSPQQVVQLRQQIDLAQRAAVIPASVPPKPVSSTLLVNLAPGTTPPAIRLAQGYVSSLVFVDSTGAPWPIAAFDIGDPKAVNLQWDGKSNVLILQAVSPYSNGDIVVRLVGLPTPITLELVAGQPVVDYRVDLHVSGIGPNTKELPLGSVLPNSANQLLLGVLDGIAPPGSKPLMVRGADCQAWLLGEKMYLRSRLTLLSPGWMGTMVSPDGTHAYELPKTSSVLVSRHGEPAELKIEGF